MISKPNRVLKKRHKGYCVVVGGLWEIGGRDLVQGVLGEVTLSAAWAAWAGWADWADWAAHWRSAANQSLRKPL